MSKKPTSWEIPVITMNNQRIVQPTLPKKTDFNEDQFNHASSIKNISPHHHEGYVKVKNGKKSKIILTILLIILIVVVLSLTATIIALYVTSINNKQETNQANPVSTKLSTQKITEPPRTTITTTVNMTCGYGYTKTYCDECGKQYSTLNVKIEGGSTAYQNSWPSIALIVFKYRFFYTISGTTYDTTKQIICGGTLIDRKTVVTAASCYETTISYTHGGTSYTATVVTNSFHPTIESMYSVYLGIQDNSFVLSQQTDQAIEISSFTTHPNYDSVNQLNDIAIIKLKTEAKLGLSIQPACLPDPTKTSYPTSTNIDSWTAGWGLTDYSTNTATNILQNVKITLYPTTSCNNVVTSKSKDWARQLCAGDVSGVKDACTGDEGGPLFVRDSVNGNLKYVLVGVTSYAQACGTSSKPRIYTKVSFYLDWISQF